MAAFHEGSMFSNAPRQSLQGRFPAFVGDAGPGTLAAGEAFLAFGPSCSSSALRFLEGLKDEEGTEDAEDVAAFLGAKNEFIMS
jgi:hypothetical protein